MYQGAANGLNQTGAANERTASRIEQDINLVKSMAEQVDLTRERIIRHARAMGYFEPPPEAKAAMPMPVITTMADALQALARSIDHCSGSLNVFE
jgi:hypothetical protein